VRSYLLLQPGDAWDPERIDRSLKALFGNWAVRRRKAHPEAISCRQGG